MIEILNMIWMNYYNLCIKTSIWISIFFSKSIIAWKNAIKLEELLTICWKTHFIFYFKKFLFDLCSVWRWFMLYGLNTMMFIIFLSICWHLINNICTLSIPHIHLLIVLTLTFIITWNFISTLVMSVFYQQNLVVLFATNQVLQKLCKL